MAVMLIVPLWARRTATLRHDKNDETYLDCTEYLRWPVTRHANKT